MPLKPLPFREVRRRLIAAGFMNPLQRIRRAIREEQYRISAHANDEMADDRLESA